MCKECDNCIFYYDDNECSVYGLLTEQEKDGFELDTIEECSMKCEYGSRFHRAMVFCKYDSLEVMLKPKYCIERDWWK